MDHQKRSPQHDPAAVEELLARYAAGRCNQDERIHAEELIATSPPAAEFWRVIRRALHESAPPVTPAARTAAVEALSKAIKSEGTIGQTSGAPRWGGRHLYDRPAHSARRVAFVVAGLAMFVAAFAGMRIHQRPSAPPTVYTTRAGERASFALANGTHITLGPASTLRLSNGVAELHGEALFVAAHDNKEPFAVITRGIRTVVLGTEFGVRNYNDDSAARVAVRSGRVMVGSAVLEAHDVALATSEQVVVSHRRDIDELLAFANGTLRIDGVTLGAAVPELNRWYDVDLRVDDPELRDTRFKTELAAGSRASLATILELTFNARATIDGRTIHLSRR